MNLIKDPWVPVTLCDGTSGMFSLADVYTQAESIKHVGNNAVTSFSVYRLLLCITQRAIDGPEDVISWKKCKPTLISKSLSYLKGYTDAFELRGGFLQVGNLSPSKKADSVSRLTYFTPSGSSHTLFDAKARMGLTDQYDDADVAMGLLCTQVFAIGGGDGRGDSGMRWGGKRIKEGRKASALSNMLLTMILGENLLSTLWYNLITKKELGVREIPFGVPVWEDVPKTQPSGSIRSYLYNLVPLNRALLIDGETVSWNDGVLPCDLDVYRDPFTTAYKGKKGIVLVKVDPNKELWRNLASLLYRDDKKLEVHNDKANVHVEPAGALCPIPLSRLPSIGKDKDITIYSGGVALDKAEKIAAMHWQLQIPSTLLIDDGNVDKLRACVVFAEVVAIRFKDAARIYMGSGKNSGYIALYPRAAIEYWQRMETHAHEMLQNAGAINTAEWNSQAVQEALRSFRHACGRILPADLQNFIKAEQAIRSGK